MAGGGSDKAIMVKAKAMYSKSLKEKEYREILRKQSIDDIASFLKMHSHYAESLRHLPEHNVSRLSLENLLRKEIFNAYLDIIRYDRSRDSFYRYLIVELEIEQLNTCLRHLHAGRTEKMILDIPGFLIPYAHIDFLKLAAVSTFAELLSVLRRTPYYPLLRPFLSSDTRHFDHIACEAALQRYYAEYLQEKIKSETSGKSRETLQNFFQRYLELNNLNLLFRLKSFPNITPQQISAYLIRCDGRLSAPEKKRLLAAESQKRFLELLQQTHLGRLLGSLSENELIGATYFDMTTARLQYKDCLRLLRFAHDGPSSFLALMMLNKIELRNLMTLIEGVRYQLEPEWLETLLIY